MVFDLLHYTALMSFNITQIKEEIYLEIRKYFGEIFDLLKNLSSNKRFLYILLTVTDALVRFSLLIPFIIIFLICIQCILFVFSKISLKKKLPVPVMRLLQLIFKKDLINGQTDYHYKKLNSSIQVLSPHCKEYQIICQYLRSGQGPTHAFRLKIRHIFNISRHGEYAAYKKYKSTKNRKLLWHGTRLSNLPSILKYGLKTNPPSSVLINGKMFGDGIYFTDVASKAAKYCKTSKNNPNGVLILAEVALGRHHYYSNNTLKRPPISGKLSTKGLGKYKPDKRQSVMSSNGAEIPLGTLQYDNCLGLDLDYSEYIVYNNDQVLFQYLVIIKVEGKY